MGVEANMEGWYGGPRKKVTCTQRQGQTGPTKSECLKEMPRIVGGLPLVNVQPRIPTRPYPPFSVFSFQIFVSSGRAMVMCERPSRLGVDCQWFLFDATSAD